MYVNCEWHIVHINKNNSLLEHVYVLATMWMAWMCNCYLTIQVGKIRVSSTGDTYMKKEYLLCKVKLKLYPIWISNKAWYTHSLHTRGMHWGVKCYPPQMTNVLHTPREAVTLNANMAIASTAFNEQGLFYSLVTSYLFSIVLYTYIHTYSQIFVKWCILPL